MAQYPNYLNQPFQQPNNYYPYYQPIQVDRMSQLQQLQNMQLFLKVLIFMDRLSLGKMRKYVTVHLSAEMPSWEKERW